MTYCKRQELDPIIKIPQAQVNSDNYNKESENYKNSVSDFTIC
jgi:hypothetical protein